MIIYTKARSKEDLEGILHLQRANLPLNLTAEEMAAQGFVTVVHTLPDLQRLNAIESHIIAKDDDKVIAYLLAMTADSKNEIPVLKPMFAVFDRLVFKDRSVADSNYIVVGQVCVNKEYRGRGILDDCYAAYKKAFQSKYDFAVTEIAVENTRSLNAHKRIGFEKVCVYVAPDGVEWQIVIWDWKNK